MTVTLGISCFYHDSAAALVRDGEIVAAAQQERFSRIKHDPGFPVDAINYCLEQAGLDVDELDLAVFYDHPVESFDRLTQSILSSAPGSLTAWLDGVPAWLGGKLNPGRVLRREIGYEGPVEYAEHHMSHAASAYYPSPFEDAAVLTVDGVGEWATASIGKAAGNRIELIREMRFPHSLGLLYSALTYFCGFKVNSGEYKLMGLASYGRPRFLDVIRSELATLHDDGSLTLNLDYFDFIAGRSMISPRFDTLFGGPMRKPESRITQREMDLAASIQVFTEEAMLKMAAEAHRLSGSKNLCLAGGVALNCVANGRLQREGPFENIWIQPAAGDAGGALGAAQWHQHNRLDIPRPASNGLDRMGGSYLGPDFSKAEIQAFLDANNVPHAYLSGDEKSQTPAQALADGKVVGFFAGRMEFGPRSLGARSILGDPRRDDTQSRMNLKIKYRESFRPFAPAVLAERVQDYFEQTEPSPYMLLVAPVRHERRIARESDELPSDDLLQLVNQKRSDIPAVTHWDYSARIQTVHRETAPDFYDLLSAFERATGTGVLVNTSFNVRGEPVVCTPDDAYRCFMRTEMDFLYLDGYWLCKTDQPNRTADDSWKEEFVLD